MLSVIISVVPNHRPEIRKGNFVINLALLTKLKLLNSFALILVHWDLLQLLHTYSGGILKKKYVSVFCSVLDSFLYILRAWIHQGFCYLRQKIWYHIHSDILFFKRFLLWPLIITFIISFVCPLFSNYSVWKSQAPIRRHFLFFREIGGIFKALSLVLWRVRTKSSTWIL